MVGQEDERLRSRSRQQRQDSAGIGADSDTAFPRRSRAGAETHDTGRLQEPGAGWDQLSGQEDGREHTTGQETKPMQPWKTDGRKPHSIKNRAAGSRAAAENRMTEAVPQWITVCQESHYSGRRTHGGKSCAGRGWLGPLGAN